jgi:two-component system cell cycle sensor histidine kinase/response regulator CckA
MKLRISHLKCFLYFTFLLLIAPQLFSEQINILILHSYHEGFKWTDDINRAIKNTLLEEEKDIQLFMEYMDSKRIPIEVLFPQLESLYITKYRRQPLDLIISSDNNAFSFLKLYRDDIFGQIPVIFTGVNSFTDALLDGFPLATGVTEDEDLSGTIDLILNLQPEVTHIAGISDFTSTGVLHRKRFADQISRYKDRVTLVPMAGLTLNDLTEQLRSLPEHSAVIYLSYFNDGAGNVFSGEEGVKIICNITNLPVYSLWDWAIWAGTIGGIVVSGEKQGIEAANMALAFLGGKAIEDIPVQKKSPNVPMFDFSQLNRVIDATERIPSNSILMNKPDSFYEQNKGLFWSVITFFVLLIALIISLLSDLLRRRKTAVILREQKNILMSTLNHIPLYVFWKDRKGNIIGGNKLFFDRFQSRGGETLAEPDFSQDERETIGELEIRSEKEPVLFYEVSLADSRGVTRDYVITVISYFDDDSPLNRILLMQDISRRHQLEIQLKQSQKMEALGRMSGGIAHDFNNLLTGIVGASDLLRADNLKSEERIEYLDMIQESCDQAAGLIKGLLSFSRKAPVKFTDITVNELLESVERILKRTIQKTIKLIICTEEKDLILSGDRSMMQSALLNLGINASHAMAGGGSLTYKAERVPSESVPRDNEYTPQEVDYLKISISDTGVGISPDILVNLFDPFFTTKEQGKGVGLGLSGVYGCVQSHGGRITVQSQLGEGSTFTIYLPMKANLPIDLLCS